MKLAYAPGAGEAFWESISRIPGYPAGEVMPIRHMLFESNALARVPDILRAVGPIRRRRCWW